MVNDSRIDLSWSGQNYLFMFDSSAGVLSCPMPEGATRWRAVYLDGDVAHGIISEEERGFPFQFAVPGKWVRVEIYDDQPRVLAVWSADLSTPVKMTDAFDVEWTIGRSLVGPKACFVDRKLSLIWGPPSTSA